MHSRKITHFALDAVSEIPEISGGVCQEKEKKGEAASFNDGYY